MSAKWKRAIVVGASSGMGAEIARLLAQRGCQVGLVARREAELSRLAAEIAQACGEPRARVYAHDVICFDQAPALFQQIARDLGGLDVVFYTAGVMPRVMEDEYSFEKDQRIFEVNVLGAMAWLNEAAERFSRANAGTIVGVSSVAGDRGRRKQPAYCASKAALSTYLEALRNRVGRQGVRVVTIKPGPVHTPMTEGVAEMPMAITATEAARQIVARAERGGEVAYVPGKWRLVMFIIRHIPSLVFKKLNI